MKKKNNILTIMKKEFARFFGDRRMVLTTLLLPGLLIYATYSLMGSAITDLVEVDEGYIYEVSTINVPESVNDMLSGKFELKEISTAEEPNVKNEIAAKNTDLLMVFPQEFDALVASYDSLSGKAAPHIEIYYNSVSTESYNAFTAVTAILNDYEASMINKFDVNVGEGFDLASKKDTTGQMFSSLLPMLLMVFMFTGCMAVAPESIAGEKERGTVATLLVTPMKRSELAIGKILSLGAIAILSGISSAAGTILAIPKLMGASGEEMNAAVYGVSDYAWLALIILSTVLVLISLISVVSAFAKTVKEATTMVTPLMILAMVVGISGMFTSAVKGAFYYYMIPLYNSVQSMIGIFTFSHNPVNIAVTVLSNLVYTCIFVFILTRMFNSERIVFSK